MDRHLAIELRIDDEIRAQYVADDDFGRLRDREIGQIEGYALFVNRIGWAGPPSARADKPAGALGDKGPPIGGSGPQQPL
ncbi:hypothetical protein SS37A_22880 [Methylocystis iwaonis]|uniref:Uncharacterized protein n=1 Tax=Methylocystis iwaonis TaxID=2885079 RepID=A0ABM8E9T2_9HYPH|nr:hypothetical protein SS37A_22880 [Methylocystis iwaonis]